MILAYFIDLKKYLKFLNNITYKLHKLHNNTFKNIFNFIIVIIILLEDFLNLKINYSLHSAYYS
jgi:hypothetical protein